MHPTINVNNLIVEVTRRCNMSCDHCLRGCSQDFDLNLDYVESLFKDIGYISTLTITGGEPSLAVDKILGIIESAKRNDVGIGDFYMATGCRWKRFGKDSWPRLTFRFTPYQDLMSFK